MSRHCGVTCVVVAAWTCERWCQSACPTMHHETSIALSEEDWSPRLLLSHLPLPLTPSHPYTQQLSWFRVLGLGALGRLEGEGGRSFAECRGQGAHRRKIMCFCLLSAFCLLFFKSVTQLAEEGERHTLHRCHTFGSKNKK